MPKERRMKNDLVLRVVGKLLIPFILLFALYVQFHGDFGPGGGFQAGVIFAAGIIFYALIFGLAGARRLVPDRLVETMLAARRAALCRRRRRRPVARRQLPRLLRARPPTRCTASIAASSGSSRRGHHGLRRDAEDLLHVRLARRGRDRDA
jgi:hypothetical protein